MAKRQKQIKVALVVQDTLQRLGLERCIHDVMEGAMVVPYSLFTQFVWEEEAEGFDVVFLESEQAAFYRDYFRTKRTHLVLLTREAKQPESVEGVEESSVVCSSCSLKSIYAQLQAVLEEYLRQQESADDRALSPRELDVLKEVALGSTNKEIAERLNISMNTVMSHRKNITAKLNIKTVSGLTFYALVNGIIVGEELIEKE